jgi:hypothetical protein
MHSRHRWLVHRDVARTVDLLLRGQLPRPQVRELDGDGRLHLRETPQPQPSGQPPSPSRHTPVRPRNTPLAPVPLPDLQGGRDEPADSDAPDPAAPISDQRPLQLCISGVSQVLLEQAIRSRRLPVQAVDAVEEADAVLAVRQQLGRAPELRRRAQDAGVPILVIKADTLPQIQRGLERLLQRQGANRAAGSEAPADEHAAEGSDHQTSATDDALAALEECRLAVEQLVLPQGQPVELLPRSEAVRQMQADLAARYQLESAVFGSGRQQRLRIFPR